MRVIVCGGRDYTDQDAIRTHLKLLRAVSPDATIIHGAAPGADAWAGYIAGTLGFHVEVHPADWARHGRVAGPIRNQEMLDSGADLVIAFPGGRGTQDMINKAESAGVPVERIQPKLAETQAVVSRGRRLR
ncbi:MAG: DUF2493 domain-containing protein [Ferrimicrobium acidiphilum]